MSIAEEAAEPVLSNRSTPRRNGLPSDEIKRTQKNSLSTRKAIRVDFYPQSLHGDFVVSSKSHRITAGQLKDKAMELIGIEKCNHVYFGLFSGTRYNPICLYNDNEELPSYISQYVLRWIAFKMSEEGTMLRHDKHAEEMVCIELMDLYFNDAILPSPDYSIRQLLNLYIENEAVGDFWRTLNSHSRCASIEGFATCQVHTGKQVTSLREGIVAVKIGIDLHGFYLFDMEGETVVMSFPWTTVTNIRVYIQPTKLFMFDIVVLESTARFLRTIVVQTPWCEYLFSLAKYVFSTHETQPERHKNTALAPKVMQQLYMQQFKMKASENQPYALLNCGEIMPFKMYAHEGMSSTVAEDIRHQRAYYLRKSYPWPHGMYSPRRSSSVSHLNDMKTSFFKVYHYSHWSANAGPEFSHSTNSVNVQVVHPHRSPLRVKDVKLATGKCLHLNPSSLKYFGLFQMNESGQRVELLQNSDRMPMQYKSLSFQVLHFNWLSEEDSSEFCRALACDEMAMNFIFWEVVAGHGRWIRNPSLLWSHFIRSRNVCHLLYALAEIADIYSVGNCILRHNLPQLEAAKKYGKKSQVITSMDIHGVHFWDSKSGTRIISWAWRHVLGLKKVIAPVPYISLYIEDNLKEKGYRCVSFQTESAGFLYSVSKILVENVITPSCDQPEEISRSSNGLRRRNLSANSRELQLATTPDSAKHEQLCGDSKELVQLDSKDNAEASEADSKSLEGCEAVNHLEDCDEEKAAQNTTPSGQCKKKKVHRKKDRRRGKRNPPISTKEQEESIEDKELDHTQDFITSDLFVVPEMCEDEDQLYFRHEFISLESEDNLSDEDSIKKMNQESTRDLLPKQTNLKPTKNKMSPKIRKKPIKLPHSSKKKRERETVQKPRDHEMIKERRNLAPSDGITEHFANDSIKRDSVTLTYFSAQREEPQSADQNRCKSCYSSFGRKSQIPQSSRNVIAPSVLVVTNREEVSEFLKEDDKTTSIAHPSAGRNRAEKHVKGRMEKDHISRATMDRFNSAANVLMSTGDDAVEQHLNQLLQITATNAEEIPSKECYEQPPQKKETEIEKVASTSYKEAASNEYSYKYMEQCTELKTPLDTTVGDNFKYYCRPKKAHFPKLQLSKEECSVQLRNNISFCKPPTMSMQDRAPKHLSKVLSLLSEVVPDTDARLFLQCFNHQATEIEKTCEISGKNTLQQ